jgi:hypothetical protein
LKSNCQLFFVQDRKFKVFLKGITMTNTPVSNSADEKPSSPATPQQQTQTNPPKPADKPSEQQK